MMFCGAYMHIEEKKIKLEKTGNPSPPREDEPLLSYIMFYYMLADLPEFKSGALGINHLKVSGGGRGGGGVGRYRNYEFEWRGKKIKNNNLLTIRF